MTRLTVDELLRYATSVSATRTLVATAGGRASFRVEVVGDGLRYSPTSSGKSRMQERRVIEEVLDAHARIGSLRPRDYQKITWNASYILGLIKHYAAQPPSTRR